VCEAGGGHKEIGSKGKTRGASVGRVGACATCRLRKHGWGEMEQTRHGDTQGRGLGVPLEKKEKPLDRRKRMVGRQDCGRRSGGQKLR